MIRRILQVGYLLCLGATTASVYVPQSIYAIEGTSPLLSAITSGVWILVVLFIIILLIFTARRISQRLFFATSSFGIIAILIAVHPLWIFPAQDVQPNLRVATVNLLWNNDTGYRNIANAIEELEIDVLFVQEYNDENDVSNLLQDFPHITRTSKPGDLFSDVLILSQIPLSDTSFIQLSDKNIPSAYITLGQCTKIQLVSVHTVSGTSFERTQYWLNDMDALSSYAYAPNIIMGGDFNGNNSMQPYRNFLIESGLEQKHSQFLTWGMIDGIKVLSLDHILASKNIRMVDSGIAGATGSDHSIIYADLYVPHTNC